MVVLKLKLKLLSSTNVNDMDNIKEGLNFMGDYSVLLCGHLNCLNAELKKCDKNNNKDNKQRI